MIEQARSVKAGVVEWISLTHYLSMFFLITLVTVPIFFSLVFTPLFFLPLAYLAWMYCDFDTPRKQGRRSSFLRNFFLWKPMVDYFPLKLHKTCDIDPSKNYMFCFHPHGIVGTSGFLNFATEATGFGQLFPGITLHPLTLNINFATPLLRDYAMGLGMGSVSRESVHYKLTQLGPGHSVLIAVGGAAEALLSDPSHPYQLKLLSRKGFVRECLKSGSSLVPIFSFGETEIFKQIIPPADSLFKKFQQFCHSSFRFVPVMFHGRFLLYPFRKPINTIGKYSSFFFIYWN